MYTQLMNNEVEKAGQNSIVIRQIKRLLADRGAWLKKEQIDQFIADRLDVLTKTSTPEEIPPFSGIYQAFIHPDSPVSVSKRLIRFRLDDPTIYHGLISRIQQSDNIPQLVADTTSSYLMGFYSRRSDIEEKNKAYYEARTRMLGENFRADSSFSIKVLADHAIALCSEHTAVTHNLLMFLGENGIFVAGAAQIPRGSEEQLHAYEIIHPSVSQAILFDPTNPIDEKGTAATYRLGPAEFKSLKEGGEVIVGLGNNQRLYKGPQYPVKQRRLAELEKLQGN